MTRAARVTWPVLPSSRSNTARNGWWWSAASPAARRTAVIELNESGWFLGENASIDGGITVILAGSRPSHA